MLKRILFVLIISSSISSCDKDRSRTVSYDNFDYQNNKASELNSTGLNLAKNGKYNESIKYFEQSIKMEPNNPITLNNIGVAYYELGENYKSIEYLNRAILASDSSYYPAFSNLLNNYSVLNKTELSIELSSYSIKNSKDNFVTSWSYIHRINNYIKQGKCGLARKDYEHLIMKFPNDESINIYFDDIDKDIKQCYDYHYP